MKEKLHNLWKFITSLFASPKEALSIPKDFPKPLKIKLLWLKSIVLRAALNRVPLANLLDQWRNAVAQFAHSFIGDLEIQVAHLIVDIEMLEQQVKLSFKDWCKNTAAGFAKEFEAAKAVVHEKYGIISETLKNLKNDLTECRIGINDFIERHQFVPSQKGFWDTTKAFIITVCFIACIEFPLVYSSLERLNLGLSIGLAFFSFLYSLVIAALCDLVGQSVARRNKLRTAFLVGLSLVFIGTLIYVRSIELPVDPNNLMYQASVMGVEQFEGVMNILSLVFLGLAMAVAIRLHRDRPYWELKALEAMLIQQIEALMAQLESKERELTAVEDVFNAKVYKAALDNEANAKKNLAAKKAELSQLNAEITGKKNLLKSYENQGIAFLTALYINGQNAYNIN